jgi:hypothetical protein
MRNDETGDLPSTAETRLGTALGITDAVTRAVVETLPTIDFRVARTPMELDAIFRARYEVALDEGWINSETWPDGRERDGWDDAAVHVAGWEGDSLVAATRLVFPVAGRSLPTEEAFDLIVEPRELVADTGRTLVTTHHRHRDHQVFFGAFCAAWQEVRAHGCCFATGAMAADVIRRCDELGMALSVLAGPIELWGEDRYAAYFSPLAFAEEIARRSRTTAAAP